MFVDDDFDSHEPYIYSYILVDRVVCVKVKGLDLMRMFQLMWNVS